MAIKLRLKHSSVNGKAPLPADLDAGELALNVNAASPAAYIKDSAGAIVKLAGVSSVGSPDATETVKGIVELATAAETTTGTDATRAVHPAGLKVELDKKANLASPALTGTPTAPTAAVGTNTTQVATTAFVAAAAFPDAPDGTVDGTVQYARQVVKAGTANTKTWATVTIPPGTHVGETAPANPKQGQQWFHSSKGKLYVYYDDGTGAAQWVVANPQEAVDYTQVYKKTEADTKFVDVSGDTMTGTLIASTVQSSSTTGDGFISLAYVGGATNAPTLFLKQNNKNFFALTATDRFYVQTQSGYIPQWIYEQAPGNAIICLGNYTAFGTANSSTVNISEELNSGTCPLRINGTAGHTNNLTRWTKAGAEVARIAETGAYYNNSDRRLKDNIADLPYGLKEIKQIQPKTFTWKNDCKEHPTTILGVIAQDIQRIIPEIISEGTPDEDGVSYLGIDSTGLTHVLINAVKELSAQVDQLTQRLAALEVKP
jgi:hypothetical protein